MNLKQNLTHKLKLTLSETCISGNTNINDTKLVDVKNPEIFELVSRVNSC